MIALALFAAATLAQVRAAPTEVRDFIERREDCHHWAGEEAYDKDRAAEIAAAQRRLRCNRIDKDAAALKRRYHKDDLVLELLNSTIEGE